MNGFVCVAAELVYDNVLPNIPYAMWQQLAVDELFVMIHNCDYRTE